MFVVRLVLLLMLMLMRALGGGRPCTMVRICDECNYGSYEGRCVICGGMGISDAFYCKECTVMEKDRDGCPKIVNLGSAKTDLFYERKKYGFKKR